MLIEYLMIRHTENSHSQKTIIFDTYFSFTAN